MSLLRFGDPTEDFASKKPRMSSKTSRYLFNNNEMSDVTFVVGKKDETAVRIPGHKMIISLASETFKTQFEGPWNKDEVRIIDFDPSPFLSLLRFIYTDDLIIEEQHVMATLYLAHMYLVWCFLDSFFNLDNLIKCWNKFDRLLTFACTIENEEYINECLAAICIDDDPSRDSFAYRKLSPEALKRICTMKTHTVDDAAIVSVCMAWAKDRCKKEELQTNPTNIRRFLEPLIKHMPFTTMSKRCFNKEVKRTKVLTESEIKHIQKARRRSKEYDVTGKLTLFPPWDPSDDSRKTEWRLQISYEKEVPESSSDDD